MLWGGLGTTEPTVHKVPRQLDIWTTHPKEQLDIWTDPNPNTQPVFSRRVPRTLLSSRSWRRQQQHQIWVTNSDDSGRLQVRGTICAQELKELKELEDRGREQVAKQRRYLF